MVSVDSKPYLVVHIGPSKTGTSTTQKDSFMFTDVLDLDGYLQQHFPYLKTTLV